VGQYNTLGKNCQTVLALPLRSGTESYGVMLIGAAAENAFDETQIDMMSAIANQASASLSAARLYITLLDQRDRMVDVEKIARAQLASELHDGPTQGVAAVSMRLNFIRKLMEKKPENAMDELFKIEDLARKTTREMRHLLFELRPMALEDGLATGLKQLAAKMEETYEQKLSIEVQPEAAELLDAQTTQILFSIVTETSNNARKHAQADLISVRVLLRDDALVLEIADNGVGFDVQKTLEAAKSRAGHLGLINLQERARFINGDLTIWSEPGNGSRTTVALPLAELRRRREESALREEASRDMAVVDA
jgi:signal transduction histidine kinase